MGKREIQVAWEEARSAENRPPESQELISVGRVRKEKRAYNLFRDKEGKYWYTTEIVKNGKLTPEKEAIFGKKGKRYVR